MAQTRPNIVFCFADDWGRYARPMRSSRARPSPNQVVRTPNIDRVAEKACCSATPLSTRPRARRAAVRCCRAVISSAPAAAPSCKGPSGTPAIPTCPLLLQDAGYHIGKTYKVWSPGTPADAPYGGNKHCLSRRRARPSTSFSDNATKMVAKAACQFDEAKSKSSPRSAATSTPFSPAARKASRFATGSARRTRTAAGSKGSGKASVGHRSRVAARANCPSSCPTCPKCARTSPTIWAKSRPWTPASACLVKKLEESGRTRQHLIVISGDHGMPGFPGGKCNLYDFGVGVSLIAAVPGINGGRVVDDLRQPDGSGADVSGSRRRRSRPTGMNGRSLMPHLASRTSRARSIRTRTWVVTGRERHVATARAGNLPYPQRALRTPDFLYIRNFSPDRWPMGDRRQRHRRQGRPSAAELENQHVRRLCRHGRQPDQGLAGRPPQRPASGNGTTTTPSANGPARNFTTCARTPTRCTTSPPIRPTQRPTKEMAGRLLNILTDAGDPRVAEANASSRSRRSLTGRKRRRRRSDISRSKQRLFTTESQRGKPQVVRSLRDRRFPLGRFGRR